MTDELVAQTASFTATIARDTPYLGALAPGETVNERGYFVRRGNRTIYPTVDRSVLVRVTTDEGRTGWGETYGIVAPDVVHVLIDELIAPLIRGRSPFDVQAIWHELYDLMRVRGYQGGFWLDAIAAVDIALWDLAAQIAGQPLHRMLGGRHHLSLPAYVSGLPCATREERVDLAMAFAARGFSAFKVAAVTAPAGIEAEIAALREALGPEAKLMVDMHWMYTPAEAVALLRRLDRYDLTFAEAPCPPEDVAGLREVTQRVGMPVAAGEEWRTVFDAKPRLDARALAIAQPEMGHTGVTQFMRIAQLAAVNGVSLMPHATIGTGIFMAASLHASMASPNFRMHEYQHSIFDRNAQMLEGKLRCADGVFTLPQGPGLGVRPADSLWAYLKPHGGDGAGGQPA